MKCIKIFQSYQDLARYSASFLYRKIKEMIDQEGDISVFLSGGNTPQSCYRYLALQFTGEISLLRKVLLSKISWYFSDERWVPNSHLDSNEYKALQNLLDPIKVPDRNIFSWQAMADGPLQCVKRYNKLLDKKILRQNKRPGIVLLGMGADGHTASLFPGGRVLFPDKRFKPLKPHVGYNAIALQVGDKWRLSLTPQFINKAGLILFFITGAAKRIPFSTLLDQENTLPASWINGQEVCYFVTGDVVDNAVYDKCRRM